MQKQKRAIVLVALVLAMGGFLLLFDASFISMLYASTAILPAIASSFFKLLFTPKLAEIGLGITLIVTLK